MVQEHYIFSTSTKFKDYAPDTVDPKLAAGPDFELLTLSWNKYNNIIICLNENAQFIY